METYRFVNSDVNCGYNGNPRYRVSSGKIVLALFSLVGGLVLTSVESRAEDFKILRNQDLPGRDIRTPSQDANLAKISFEECVAVCRATAGCKAFTFNDNYKKCFLKSGMSRPKPHKGAISGVLIKARTASQPKKKNSASTAGPIELPVRSPKATVQKPVKADVKRNVKSQQSSENRIKPQTSAKAQNIPMQATPVQPKQKQAMKVSTKPLIMINNDAKLIHQNLIKGRKLASLAAKISAQYLEAYDKETGGIKWVSTKSVGITVPMSTSTSQAKALILDKMGKSSKLRSAQDQLDVLEEEGSKLLPGVLKLLKPDIRQRLVRLHEEKVRAGKEFKIARDKLQSHGDSLNSQADKSWKLPSGAPLARLHELAADMRKKRLEAIQTGKAFSDALKSALETPDAVLVL